MKIKKLHFLRIPHPWKTRVYVVAEGENGMTGIGESTVSQVSNAVLGALRDLSLLITGFDSSDSNRLRALVGRDIYADGGQILGAALGGIEAAFSDLEAQGRGVPLYADLGGMVREKIPAYANGWYRGERDPEVVAALGAKAVAKGYRALKIDPFGSNWRTLPKKEMDLSLAILGALRQAVGSEVEILVEAHSRFDLSTAIKLSRRLEKIEPMWLEEPVPFWDIPSYKKLVSSSGVPIAAGESLSRLDQFVDLIRVARVPIIQFDPTHVGGVQASRAICELALAQNASIAPHSASSVVTHTICAHFCLSQPHALILERFQDFEGEDEVKDGITSAAKFSGGFVSMDEKPGLGLEYELEHLLSLHSDKLSEDLNLYRKDWQKREKV